MADRTTFFKVDRGIFDHWIFGERPFSRFQAWIWLIGKANFADKTIMYRGEPMTVKRGQLAVSLVFLAKEWGWSRERVRRFLRALECDKMVHTERTSNGTLVTIENYAKFQDSRHTDDTTDETTGVASHIASHETQNKKEKKEKNVCDAHAVFSPPSLDEVRAYCEERRNGIDPQSFMDYYANRDWPKDWKAAIRRWESYDRKQTEPEPTQTHDEADRAWADVISMKAWRSWEDVLLTIQNETARNVLNRMLRTGEIELQRQLADGSVQTIPNRQRFVELYRKEMMS